MKALSLLYCSVHVIAIVVAGLMGLGVVSSVVLPAGRWITEGESAEIFTEGESAESFADGGCAFVATAPLAWEGEGRGAAASADVIDFGEAI